MNFVLPGPALAPDQDGLHLGTEGLLPDDAQLQGQARVGRHASAFAVAGKRLECKLYSHNQSDYLRVQSWSGILDLLDEAGHVLEEEIVKMLLLHVFELESRFARLRHDEVI